MKIKNCVERICIMLGALSLAACSPGDLRAFDDAMAEELGHTRTYPDQSYREYVGDVLWVHGVRSEQSFSRLSNTGKDYCKVRLNFEDDTSRVYYLDPGESTSNIYSSIYNQTVSAEALCGTTSAIYDESF